jgi:hypothetical protein
MDLIAAHPPIVNHLLEELTALPEAFLPKHFFVAGYHMKQLYTEQ